jgi:hypothetical protein
MPFQPLDETVRESVSLIAKEIPKTPVPSFGETASAAFRLENTIGSMLAAEPAPEERPDLDYDVISDIEGTKYDTPEIRNRFAGSFGPQTTRAIMSQLDREKRDRDTIEASPFWSSLALTGAAAVLDPTILLPGGQVVRGAKAGQAVGRSALNVGAASAGATAIQEAALHATQQTRTVGESAINIAAGTALGSVLGGLAGTLSRGAQIKLAKKIETQIADLKAADDTFSELTTGGSAGAASADLESAIAARLRDDLGRDPSATEIADAIDDSTRLVGEAVIKRTPLVSIQDPLIRTALSDSRTTREVAMRLAESPLEFRGAKFGESMSAGGSVEGRIRLHQRKLDRTLTEIDAAYNQHFMGRAAGNTRVTASKVVGGRSDKMTREEFRQEVFMAMLDMDRHSNPEVARAAKATRESLINPTTKDAQDAGVLGRELSATDHHGESYAPTVYRTAEIVSRKWNSDPNNPGFGDLLLSELTKSQGKAQSKLALTKDLHNAQSELDKATELQFQLKDGLKSAIKKARAQKARADVKAGQLDEALNELDRAAFRLFRRLGDAKAKDITPEDKAAAKELIDFVKSAEEPKSLFDAIRARGGIKPDDNGELVASTGVEKTGYTRKGKLVFPKGSVAVRDGMQADDMRVLMAEEGYIGHDATLNDFYDLISAESRGEKAYSYFDAEQAMLHSEAKAIREELDNAGVGLNVDSVIGLIRSKDGEVPVDVKSARREASVAVKGEMEVQRVRDSLLDRLNEATKRGAEARARIDEVNENIAPRLRERIAEADARVASARKSFRRAKEEHKGLEEFSQMSADELTQWVEDIMANITKAPEGRVMLTADFSKVGPRGALRERTLNFISRRLMAEHGFIETDIEKVARHYMRTVPVDTELHRMFGSSDMDGEIRAIADEYDAQMREASGDSKLLKKLEKHKIRDIKDVEGMRDRIRGLYAIPDNPDAFLVRTGRALRSFNYIRLLGGMTISAIPDLGKVIMSEGPVSTMRGLYGAMSDWKRMSLLADEVKDAGTSLDMSLGTRAMSWADVTDNFSNQTKFERGLSAVSGRFGLASLMNPWNAGLKQFLGGMIIQRVVKSARKIADGTASEADISRLAQAGITRTHIDKIVEQVAKHGDLDGSFILPNGNNWDANAQDALEAFRVAIGRDVDRAIVTPGQDKPLLMSTEIGGLIGQFQSFGFSTVQRTMIAGMQQRDANALMGFMSMFSLGALSYYFKEINAGREPSDDPAVIAAEAFDRSGVVGWLMNVNNLTERFSGGRVGLSALTGEELSRFQIRNLTGSLLGPSAGILPDVAQVSAAAFQGDIRESDVHRARFLVPGQNLFYLRWLVNELESATANVVGAN